MVMVMVPKDWHHNHDKVHDRSTRASEQRLLRLPIIKTEGGWRQFMFRAANAYNALPASVRKGP